MALSRRQIAQAWVNAGGDPRKAGLMAEIGIRESGGRPKINNRGTNKNGTVDWGLFQINDIWRKDPVVGPLFRSGAILTPEGNAKAAVHIMRTQGPRAWATYNAGIDAKYLGGFKHLKAQEPLARQLVTKRQMSDGSAAQPDALKKLLAGAQGPTPGQQYVANLLAKRNPGNPVSNILGASTGSGVGPTALAAALSLTAKDPKIDLSGGPAPKDRRRSGSSASLPRGGGKGKFIITGPNPGRLKPELVGFARKVAAVYGKPLTGSDGSGHSRMTVNGNVSEHTTGQATDIPAYGQTLIRMGRAALIAAGMPRAQALKQTGGLFNVYDKNGYRHQIIFNTHEGGDHTNHLHISSAKR